MQYGSYAPDRVEMIALRGLPMVGQGMDLAELIAAGLEAASLELQDDDILVVAQKIVSKAEGRMVRLADVTPSKEARRRGRETGKDPALVQLILDESVEVLRQGAQVLIVEHRLGLVMANAGIDQSNAAPGCAILLPLDPDASAARLALALGRRCGCRIGVIIIDSFGRAWRNGHRGSRDRRGGPAGAAQSAAVPGPAGPADAGHRGRPGRRDRAGQLLCLPGEILAVGGKSLEAPPSQMLVK